MLLAATRRYSTTRQRSISFSVIYMIMNVGYVTAGWIFDYIRKLDFHFSFFGLDPTPHQQLFLVSLAFEILIFPAIYLLRRDEDSESFAAHATPAVSRFAFPRRSGKARPTPS